MPQTIHAMTVMHQDCRGFTEDFRTILATLGILPEAIEIYIDQISWGPPKELKLRAEYGHRTMLRAAWNRVQYRNLKNYYFYAGPKVALRGALCALCANCQQSARLTGYAFRDRGIGC